jgi:hypothetical protein
MRIFSLALFFLFFFTYSPVRSQNIIDQDLVLKSLRTQIPEGWVMEAKGNRIVFMRKDSVWTKSVNKINKDAVAHKPNAEERMASFKKEGKRAQCMLSYRYEPLWTKSALKKAQEQNKKVFETVAKLPAKYKIEALLDSGKTKNGTDAYIPKTDADKVQVGKYETERNKLMSSLVAVPFLNTEKYSLFADTSSGYEDAFTDVYPEQASMEWYKIQNTVTSICGMRSDQPGQ